VTAQFAQIQGQLVIWYGSDRRVIMYPCDKNRQLNFVCIHPREESEPGKIDGEHCPCLHCLQVCKAVECERLMTA
jgi:hypothetical protein